MRLTALSALALPLLLVPGPVDAQTSKNRTVTNARAQMSLSAIEARERCSQQARYEVPFLTDEERSSPYNHRIAIYASCVRGLGYRP